MKQWRSKLELIKCNYNIVWRACELGNHEGCCIYVMYLLLTASWTTKVYNIIRNEMRDTRQTKLIRHRLTEHNMLVSHMLLQLCLSLKYQQIQFQFQIQQSIRKEHDAAKYCKSISASILTHGDSAESSWSNTDDLFSKVEKVNKQIANHF
jgi:hypothetical protein